ncbi:MAG TPA: hypothetical protein VD970_16230 [Acetobacteraceae bacterium]|nr:hypothetical protein [Acetobacteraceae bacterium]
MRRLHLLLLPVLALLLMAQAQPEPPEAERYAPGRRAGLVNDGAGGCWLRVGGMTPDVEAMRATWTGPCVGGLAEGKGRSVMTWRQGGQERSMVYEGELRAGLAEGRGRLTHLRGETVIAIEEGEFREDRFVQGRWEVPGQVTYEGGWGLQGPEGQGRAVIQGRRFEGLWQAGCLRLRESWISFLRSPRDCEGTRT